MSFAGQTCGGWDAVRGVAVPPARPRASCITATSPGLGTALPAPPFYLPGTAVVNEEQPE